MKRFNSKKDWSTRIVVWATSLLCIFGLLVYGPVMPLYFMMPITAALVMMVWSWIGTYYIIDENQLIYKNGPFGGEVDIDKITKIIKDSKDRFNSGNLSKDKMAIYHIKGKKINISPESKEEFINQLCQINKNIIVE